LTIEKVRSTLIRFSDEGAIYSFSKLKK